MTILLTNDDGVQSPGIAVLQEELREHFDVWILAPDGERSAGSHRITIGRELTVRQIDEHTYACSGTPADCVILGMLGAIPRKPDIVLSGINLGPNFGTDLIYSGTAAAARQGALMGVPGVAVSLHASAPPYFFGPVTRFVQRTLEAFRRHWDGEHFVNINAPNAPDPDPPVVLTRPGRRSYSDKLRRQSHGDSTVRFTVEGVAASDGEEPGTDAHAVRQGSISVSAIALHPERYDGAVYAEAFTDGAAECTPSE